MPTAMQVGIKIKMHMVVEALLTIILKSISKLFKTLIMHFS